MVNTIKNLILGAFLLIGCAAIVAILLVIKPHVGDEKQVLYVRFSSVMGISQGTRVSLAGKPIGVVGAIQPIKDARKKEATTQNGSVYFYLVKLRVDSGITLYTTDEIVVESKGLLGEKNINIIPKPLCAQSRPYSSEDKICAYAMDGIEDTFREVSALSIKARETISLLQKWLELYGGELGDTVYSVNQTVKEARKTFVEINESNIVQATKDTIVAAEDTLRHLEHAITQFDTKNFIEYATSAMRNLNTITGIMASGKGTLGKLLTCDNMYLGVDAVIGKANILLNDINQYGLLFQYNKEWLRMRSMRMAAMNAMKDPKAFSEQMNRELDTLNTSLERIEAATQCTSDANKALIENSACFQKAFRDFMQRIDLIREQVQLYNQKLYDVQQEKCHESCPTK